jgi:hypothetical protein
LFLQSTSRPKWVLFSFVSFMWNVFTSRLTQDHSGRS